MSGSTVTQSEIARYVDGVRAALADLPPGERDELLDDLPDHLAEVAAEGAGTLEERLGPPAAYAAELRATAGIAATRRETLAESMANVAGEARRRLRRVDTRLGPVLGYETASAFLRLLRPAWWVLRGYLAAVALAYLVDNSDPGLLPRAGGNELAGLVLVAAGVLASIWLGRRTGRMDAGPRRLTHGAGAVLVVIGLIWFVDVDQRARNNGWYEPVYGNPYGHISDVYVYDDQGRPLSDVRLFDQNGQPIQLGSTWCDDGPSAYADSPLAPYPRCPQQAPFAVAPIPEPRVTQEPDPATGEPTAQPSPTTTPAQDPPTPGPTPAPTPS